MKCRFCEYPMLPISDINPDSDTQVDHNWWECHHCPATVRQYGTDKDWFSILAFFHGHWYEVMQFYVLDQLETQLTKREPPLVSVFKLTVYMDGNKKPCVKSEMVVEVNEDAKLTPQNIHQKLATLVVFS